MSDIENMKKSLDTVEKALIVKAVKDDTAKKELKESIAKQLDTLILKAEVELLQKHLTSDMFTKPVTEPAKAIAKPAIDVGKKVGSAVGKIGRSIADYGKGIGTAAKTGASTWKDPTKTSAPKTHIDVYENISGKKVPNISDVHPETAKKKPSKHDATAWTTEDAAWEPKGSGTGKKSGPGGPGISTPKQTNINVTTSSKVPAAIGARPQIKKKAAPIKQEPVKPVEQPKIEAPKQEAAKPVTQPKTETSKPVAAPTISTGTGEDTAKQMASAQRKRSSGGI